MPLFTLTVFGISLVGLGGMLLVGYIEERLGRRVLFPRLRGNSDGPILSFADTTTHRTARLLNRSVALMARFVRVVLAEGIMRGRKISARLRDIAEHRRSLPGSKKGAVSNFLQTIAEHKKETPHPPLDELPRE